MKRRVADIIVDILVENEIDNCFAVVGGGAMHLDNALALNDSIDKYFNHHEQACAMAAEAYARISGKMAAVCIANGPGATNAITGVMGCWQDSLPMLVLSGEVRSSIAMGSGGLPLQYGEVQKFNIIDSVQNMTKYAVMVKDPLDIKRQLKKAINIALTGRRGPVWLDIPLDVQSAQIEEEDMYDIDLLEEVPRASREDISFMLAKLKSAKRPCILVGNGVANTHNIEKFREFSGILNVPVVAACIAADAMYTEYPDFYGMSGSLGSRTGNFIVQNADVIVSIGCSLGFKMTGFAQEKFAPKAFIISVEIDENEVKKPGVRVDKLIHTDLSEFFNIAHDMIEEIKVQENWREYCSKLKARFSPFEPGEGLADDDRVCAYRFWKEYEMYEPDNNISVLGNNTANSAKLQIGIKKKDQRIVANNNCGSMGADLPEAIGAAVASGREVICLTGDGSIMMNLQELQTIHHYKLPVKVVVFSNDGYNAIKQTSKNFFNGKCIGCSPETGVSFPDFEKVAQIFNFKYNCCHNNGEIAGSLKWLFEEEGNVLLEVLQQLDDPVTPKVMSRMKDDGTFDTPSLEDMAPFITQEEHDSLMFW